MKYPSLHTAVAYAAAVVLMSVAGVASAQPSFDHVVGNYEIYFGCTSAGVIAKNYSAGSPESQMHGGIPRNGGDHHVMVAVFNRITGKRISNATVSAKVWSADSPSVPVQRKVLGPMQIAGDVTYGNYFYMPPPGTYDVEVQISIPGVPEIVTTFKHYHGGN